MSNFNFRKDFLYVYDGPTMASSRSFTLTGSSIPHNIITTGPDAFIRYVKESQLFVKGFELRYDTGKS